uniref:Protein phosphatase 1 regulatory subunit 16B n=1 Tax=Leptobrachium leishanense TaxID=445787 RepID=A0A8C5QVH6_9ANUR
MTPKPMDLLTELQLLEKASTLERLRAAKKRREQQLKRWAQNERDEERRRRQQRTRRKTPPRSKRVSFPSRVVLHEACLRNDPDEVLSLLQNNVDPNLCNEDGLTTLHQCCIDNYEDLLRLLLSHGANINVTDNELWTPLHAAATCGHTNLVRILIQHGADLLAVNADGNMVYDLCEDEETLDVIENCMTYKGITQEMINEARQTPEREMLDDVRALIAARKDLNRTDGQGATLLHIAASRGYAEVDVKDSDCWEPLHAAAFWGQIYVAEILVSHGASLSSKTSLDETPLDLCEDEELRSLLLELKHKHDLIMKSQQKNKSSLSRRSSSTGSHGKVVRRASLSERTNLYRREYEKEAVVWQCLVSAEDPDGAQEEEESSPDIQRVIAVVMDAFTDNDLFRDMHEASRKRRVPVYILVDQSQLPHFLTMCQNLGVSLEAEQLMRVRSLTGSNYYTRSGAKIVGKARERFLLVDGLKVATGSYSYTWMDGKLNSSNVIVLSGQVVEKFDLQFRVLYAQSNPVKYLSSAKNRPVMLDQLLCNLPSHRKANISNLVQMELAKISSTPKRAVNPNKKGLKELPSADYLRTGEDEWLNCDIVSGLKEIETVATQTEPWEGRVGVVATDAATQTSVSSASAATQTFMPARAASTQTVVFSREMTTQTSQFAEPAAPSNSKGTTTTTPYSNGIRLSSTSSTSSSSSSSSASNISTGSSNSIRSTGVSNRLQQSEYPLRDNIKKLTKERQYHYSTIRSKLDHMVSILSRRNRFGGTYLGCEPAGYGFRRDVVHSSLLNLRDGARFAHNL